MAARQWHSLRSFSPVFSIFICRPVKGSNMRLMEATKSSNNRWQQEPSSSHSLFLSLFLPIFSILASIKLAVAKFLHNFHQFFHLFAEWCRERTRSHWSDVVLSLVTPFYLFSENYQIPSLFNFLSKKKVENFNFGVFFDFEQCIFFILIK